MANDIPGHDRYDPVPWNPESGKQIAPPQTPVVLAWGDDIFVDPARTDSVADPALGFDAPYTKVSEI